MKSYFKYHTANSVTGLGLLLSTFAVIHVLLDRVVWVAILVVVICAFLDGLDGWVARRMNAASPLGRFLDAGHDMIAFGIVPVLVIVRTFDSTPRMLIAVLGFYVCAMAFRLIRALRRNTPEIFYGLPAPLAGLAVTLGCGLIIRNHEPLCMGSLLLVIFFMIVPLKITRPWLTSQS